MIFVFFRFNDSGRDFCMGYTNWNPLAPFVAVNGVSTLNLRLENENWGIGNFTGISIFGNGVSDGRYVIQF